MNLVYVALGGGLGAVLRYVVGLNLSFPFGTLTVNILGSFLIGLLAVGIGSRGPLPLFLITGLLGGFTTFSAFSLDVLKLIELERIDAALGYVTGSVLMSLLAAFGGVILAKALWV